MKLKHGLLCGFAVIAMAAIVMLAGCDDGSTNPDPGTGLGDPTIVTYTGTANNKTYTLKITNNTSYELTVGNKTSSGSAVYNGSAFTCTPTGTTAPFTATVSGAGITDMGGTITFNDHTTEPAPSSMTPPQIPGGSSLSSIQVITPPSKLVYDVGESLDLNELVVRAVYEDASQNYTGYTLEFNGAAIVDGAILTAAGKSLKIKAGEANSSGGAIETSIAGLEVYEAFTKESFLGTWGDIPEQPTTQYEYEVVISSENIENGATLVFTGRYSTRNTGVWSEDNRCFVTITLNWGSFVQDDMSTSGGNPGLGAVGRLEGYEITGSLSNRSSASFYYLPDEIKLLLGYNHAVPSTPLSLHSSFTLIIRQWFDYSSGRYRKELAFGRPAVGGGHYSTLIGPMVEPEAE